ncbi:hypothetical protein [Flavobacterium difficile]|uniref:Uncharacterized protein n=1 Tax=Flavobacterium difficile TaxID=2709659 RepID=A0ABX0I5K2_9FLAO|nr:hypothetical protein [Flavobacterium difficile]NHM02407.1 hypothetical protein [Flavobacterium difficile]
MNDFIEDFEDEDDDKGLSFAESTYNLYQGDSWDYDDKYIMNQEPREEIDLYNQSLTYEENFEDGKKVKFILVPLFKDEKDNDTNFTPLLNAGSKIIMNRKELAGTYSEQFHYIIVDYNSIFGLRLLSFQRYNNFFSCDERVLFETFIIKFHSFKFKEFYMSIPTIYKELGIKETRANTIIKRFIELGIITKKVKPQVVNDIPSQVSYYCVIAEKVIELLPIIFDNFCSYDVEKDIEKYLEPALKKQTNKEPE